MKLTTELTKDEDGLAMLLAGIFNVTSNRALWAIQKAKLKTDDIEEFNDYVTELRLTLNKENRKFKKDAEGFLETFVLDDNHVMKAHQLVFRKMSHSLVGVRRVLAKFAMLKNARSNAYKNVDIPSLYENSYIGNNTPRANDAFGIDSYGDEVRNLCENLEQYFAILYNAMDECFKLLRNEKIIKGDPVMVMQIYADFRKKVVDEFFVVKETYGMTPASIAMTPNPLLERRKKFVDDASFLQSVYHDDTPVNVKRYIIQKEFCGKSVHDETPEERALFGDDYNKISRIRTAITHFNALAHRTLKGEVKKIDAKSVAAFAAWCGIPSDKNNIYSFYSYFINGYNKNSDCLNVAKDERVYKASRNLTLQDKSDFNSRIENLLFQIEQSKKNIINL